MAGGSGGQQLARRLAARPCGSSGGMVPSAV